MGVGVEMELAMRFGVGLVVVEFLFWPGGALFADT